MQKVRGSRCAGVQEKNNNAQGAWIKWISRKEKNGGVEENQGRDSAQNRAIKSSFIHTVSTNYQCIYSIPSSKTMQRIHN